MTAAKDILLPLEDKVERGPGDAGLFRDIVHGGARMAIPQKHVRRGRDHAVSSKVRLRRHQSVSPLLFEHRYEAPVLKGSSAVRIRITFILRALDDSAEGCKIVAR